MWFDEYFAVHYGLVYATYLGKASFILHYLAGVAANYKVVERIDCLFFYTNVSALFSYKLTMLGSLYNFELSRMLWLELVENTLANPGADVYGLFLRICYICLH